MRPSVTPILALVGVAVLAPAASASTIVWDRGIAFTLVNNGLLYDDALGTDAFEFVYSLNTAGYDEAGNADFIGARSIKVTTAELTAANSRLADYSAPGVWTYVPDSASSQGGGGPSCGSGGGGWACASDGTSPIVPGGIYTFTFLLVVSEASLLVGPDAASIHAAYGRFDRDGDVKPAGVTSSTITIASPPRTPQDPPLAVPEPTSLMLLGLGLMAVAVGARRQLR